MSKDLAVAGVIVLCCIAVSVVAFVKPNPEPGKPVLADNPPKRPSIPEAPVKPSISEPHPLDPTIGLDPVVADNPNNKKPPADPLNDPLLPVDHGHPFQPPAPPRPEFKPMPPPPVPEQPLPPPVADAGLPKTHIVAEGETLSDVSLKYYNTHRYWREIQKANPDIDANNMKVGQKLVVPPLPPKAVDPVKPAKPETPPVALADGESSYTIKKGDNYYNVAARELGDASRFREVEKLNSTPGEELKIGQVIKLPPKHKAADPKPVTPVNDVPGAKEHVVVKGETLMDISTKYFNTTKRWRDIEKANPGIDAERLREGQKIKIPDLPAAAPAPKLVEPKEPDTAPAPGEMVEYTVKSGDLLETIAQKFYHDGKQWPKIKDANPGVDPNSLRIGQKLKIPGIDKPKAPAAPDKAPATGGDKSPKDKKPASPFGPTGNTPPASPTAPKSPFAPKMDGSAQPSSSTRTSPSTGGGAGAAGTAPVKRTTSDDPLKDFNFGGK